MCLTETLDELVSSGVLSPELAIQVLIQFDKSINEALEKQIRGKISVKVLRQRVDFHIARRYVQK